MLSPSFNLNHVFDNLFRVYPRHGPVPGQFIVLRMSTDTYIGADVHYAERNSAQV